LLNVLTALSLLLCVASVAAWAVGGFVSCSHVTALEDSAFADELNATFETHHGLLVATFSKHGFRPLVANYPLGWTFETGRYLPDGGALAHGWGGFGYETFDTRSRFIATSSRALSLGSPLWCPAALFALLPIARLYRRLRPKHPVGHCPR